MDCENKEMKKLPSKKLPYQCDVPRDLHIRVKAKMSEAGISIAPFVRQVFRELDERPITESVRHLTEIKKQEKRHK